MYGIPFCSRAIHVRWANGEAAPTKPSIRKAPLQTQQGALTPVRDEGHWRDSRGSCRHIDLIVASNWRGRRWAGEMALDCAQRAACRFVHRIGASLRGSHRACDQSAEEYDGPIVQGRSIIECMHRNFATDTAFWHCDDFGGPMVHAVYVESYICFKQQLSRKILTSPSSSMLQSIGNVIDHFCIASDTCTHYVSAANSSPELLPLSSDAPSLALPLSSSGGKLAGKPSG